MTWSVLLCIGRHWADLKCTVAVPPGTGRRRSCEASIFVGLSILALLQVLRQAVPGVLQHTCACTTLACGALGPGCRPPAAAAVSSPPVSAVGCGPTAALARRYACTALLRLSSRGCLCGSCVPSALSVCPMHAAIWSQQNLQPRDQTQACCPPHSWGHLTRPALTWLEAAQG